MKTPLVRSTYRFAIGVGAALSVAALSAHAQDRPADHPSGGGDHPEVGGGHAPPKGPAPAPRNMRPPTAHADDHPAPAAPAEHAPPLAPEPPGHPASPHADASNDHWVGHDTGPNDPHYPLDRPWEHG